MKNKKNLLILAFVICIIAVSIKIPTSYGSIFDHIYNYVQEKNRNEVHYRLGSELGKVIEDNNKNLKVVQINAEDIKLNEWYYYKTCSVGRAKEMGTELPTDEAILQQIIERKLKVDAAKQMGIYPGSQEIESYVNEQRELAADSSDLQNLLEGWNISENEYYDLIQGTWADSLAIDQWYNKVVLSQLQKPEEPADQPEYIEKLQDVYHKELDKLRQNAIIEITEEGKEIGL